MGFIPLYIHNRVINDQFRTHFFAVNETFNLYFVDNINLL